MELLIDKLKAMCVWLEESTAKYADVQSIDVLITDIGLMVNVLAFCNNQMAIAKRILNEAKTAAYGTLISKGNTMAPSLAKDYIAAKCSEQQYSYDIAERSSRTVTHSIDALRTCVSALKAERITSNFA